MMAARLIRCLELVVVVFAATQSYGQVEPDFETRVVLQVKDGRGAPVVGADASLGFLHLRKDSDVWLKGRTDESGRFEATEKVVGSLRLSVRKEGYYSLSKRKALIRMDVDDRQVKDVTFPLVMREKISAIGLFSKRVSTAFPEFDQWMGFDLKSGRWKAENEECDFQLKFTRKLIGFEESRHTKSQLLERLKKAHNPRGRGEGRYPHLIKFYEQDRSYSDDELIEHSLGKWSGNLEIRFPGEEGIVVVDRDFVPYCELKMPHLAYEKGYVSSRVWTKENWGLEKEQGERGYFLRTRVKLDESGEIVSANYAKFIEEIEIDSRGRIEFAYGFNPTANDRNLEFDPSKNLFGKLSMDEEVRTP